MTNYARSLLIALVFIPLVALLAQFLTRWLARFRPRYLSALASVATACVLGGTIAVAIAKVCAPPDSLSFAAAISPDVYTTKEFIGDIAMFCAGFVVSSACHRLIVRGPKGERLTSWKAVQLTTAQMVAGLLLQLAVRVAL